MKPIDLLTAELRKYQSALQHSFESYKKGGIIKEVHEKHKANCEAWIFQYKQAIDILKMWMD